MVEELKAYLKEAHDGIRKMYLENLSLSKEYVKSVEDIILMCMTHLRILYGRWNIFISGAYFMRVGLSWSSDGEWEPNIS